MSFKEKFGKRLKYWREKRGITRAELGKCAELKTVSPAITIGDFEAGTEVPRISDIEKMAKVLGIAPQVLMGGTRKIEWTDDFGYREKEEEFLRKILRDKEVESVQFNSSCMADSGMSEKCSGLMVIYWDYDEGNKDE